MSIETDRIRAICFDIDGTLSDTDNQMITRIEPWFKPLRLIFSHYKVHKFIRRIVMGVEAPVNVVYGLLDRLGLDLVLIKIMTQYSGKGFRKKRAFLLMTGVKKTLEILSDRFPLAIISARDEASAREFLSEFHLESFFKVVVTSQTCPHTKPFPDQLIYAARLMNICPEDCLMVGDSPIDIRTGQRAGAQTVGVLCGFGTRKELIHAGADLIIPHTSDLIDYL